LPIFEKVSHDRSAFTLKIGLAYSLLLFELGGALLCKSAHAFFLVL